MYNGRLELEGRASNMSFGKQPKHLLENTLLLANPHQMEFFLQYRDGPGHVAEEVRVDPALPAVHPAHPALPA